MSDRNALENRVVWIDVPVADLDRAVAFYKSVLAVEVTKQPFDGGEFGVLEHNPGNGGCLVVMPDQITDKGSFVYFGVDGRIRDAEAKVAANGGEVLQGVHAIGPHGFRSVVKDSEGNRIVLHSETDA